MMLSPDVKFSGATEALTVTGGVSLSFNRYLNQPQLNIDTYDLSLRSRYKAERDSFQLNLDAIRDSTLVSELATTGVVLAYAPRNLFTVTPTWSRALTEATSVNASYTYTDVKYHAPSDTSLINYQDQLASVGLQSNVDEGKILNVAAYYDRYETPSPGTIQNTYGVQGGYDHAFSETLHGVGGRCIEVADDQNLRDELARLEPVATAKKICSLIPDVLAPNVDLSAVEDPHQLEDVDVAVVPGHFAVAENAAVWVTDEQLRHRAVLFIVQHLVLVVPRAQVLDNMHEAYERLRFQGRGFGAFISGPSKTADIEQSLVIGAHGPRSLTVFLVG
jgi:L-lactate dehydrogenase complex protein LldG